MFCTGSYAQTTQGFTGLVTDSTGGVIPNTKITVHNEGTGLDKSVITTSTGDWSVPFLDPGIYDVRAEASEFKSVNKTNITLSTGETAEVNFILVPGAAIETITVNASQDVLDYDKADRGNVLNNELVEELPTFDNATFNFAFYTPGMMTTTPGQAPGNQSAQTFGIHGGGVEFSLDGVTNESETGSEHYTLDPPTQAVQEFKITTSPLDAANGRSPGGQIDMSLKTGTKALHGAAYWYGQREFMDANSPVNDANVVKGIALSDTAAQLAKFNKPAFTQNQYGFELDGPVAVPKIWGREKHSFFMILYEDLNNFAGPVALTSVPSSSAMANGDFSSFLGIGSVPGVTGLYNQAIYDPTTEASCTAHNTDTATSVTGGKPAICRYQYGYGPPLGTGNGSQGNPQLIGTPNVIPGSEISKVAQAMMSWYPAPNTAPTPTTANPFNNNYAAVEPNTSDNKTYIVKFDQNAGENNLFDVTGHLWKYYGVNNSPMPRNNVNEAHPGINEADDIAHYNGTDYRYPALSASWTHTFTPTLVNAFRGLVTTALESDSTGPASGFDPSNIGMSSSIGAASPLYFQRFPLTNVSNYFALGSQAVLLRGDDALQLTDTVNWTRGNHVMHLGGEVRFQQYSQKSTNNTGFTLATDDGWTQQWDTTISGKSSGLVSQTGYANNYSGNSLASMEAGTWSATGTVNATTAGGNYVSSHYGALYFQDDWKYRPNLTLNLGVRWEDPGRGLRDRFNRLNSVWDFTDQNPVTSLVSTANLPVLNGFVGGPTYAGVNGNPTWEFKRVWYEFGPRAGFAYTWNQKTVIRGGIGLFFNDQAQGNLNSPSNIGYSTTNGYTANNPQAETNAGGVSTTLMIPTQNLGNPFPTFQAATGNCGGNLQQCLESNMGQTSTFENPKYHPGFFLSDSFGIERQLSSRDTVDISYVGTRLYSNAYTDDMNHISASAQAACDPLRGGLQTNCTAATASIANPFLGVAPFAGSSYYTASTLGKIQFTRPYPQFQSINQALINGGKNWYNGLEAIYIHRTSFGLTTNVGYTYSKFITANGYADTINRIPSRTISGTDAPHRLTALVVYKLPFARGSGFFPNMPRVLDLVIGGWQTSNAYEYQSGFPQALGVSGTTAWIVDQHANGGNLLPKQRFWPGNSNPWYPAMQAGTNANSYIQRLKPCVVTIDPVHGEFNASGTYNWISQSQTLANAGLCTAPNYIQINTTYQAVPNVEYTGAREAPNNQLNSNIAKNFKIHENIAFQMRIDAINAFNHLQYSSNAYDTSTSDGTFGMLQLGASGPTNATNRQIQLAGRLTW
jgi:hypothetical protein